MQRRCYDDPWLDSWAKQRGGRIFGECTMILMAEEATILAEHTGRELADALNLIIDNTHDLSIGEIA